MKTSMEVIREMLEAEGPQTSWVLPCHFAFPIPALSAYQYQIALEQEITNEETAQVQIRAFVTRPGPVEEANTHPVHDS